MIAVCRRILTCLLLAVAGPVLQEPAQSATRFETWNVYLDTGAESLGAYQFEWRVLAGVARIVGVEAGEHPAFAEAPYHDEAALQRGRIIVGAYSLASELPRGRTRVARIHLQIEGPGVPEFGVELEACAAGDGRDIVAMVANEIMRE